MENEIAKHFLSIGLQHWGQSDDERQKAKDDYLRAAGFDLRNRREQAEEWLKGVLAKMTWGKLEREADYLAAALDAKKSG